MRLLKIRPSFEPDERVAQAEARIEKILRPVAQEVVVNRRDDPDPQRFARIHQTRDGRIGRARQVAEPRLTQHDGDRIGVVGIFRLPPQRQRHAGLEFLQRGGQTMVMAARDGEIEQPRHWRRSRRSGDRRPDESSRDKR